MYGLGEDGRNGSCFLAIAVVVNGITIEMDDRLVLTVGQLDVMLEL